MKKTLVFFALAFISIANAQKGTILVAGSIGISSQKQSLNDSEHTTNSITISPKVGYQFNEKWTVGAESSISNSKYEYNSTNNGIPVTNENRQKGFAVGGFIRYTKPLSGVFSVYADFGVGFHNTKSSYESFNGTETSTGSGKVNGFNTQLTPALSINFAKGFGLNFNLGGLGYQTNHYENDGGDINNFYFNFGQTVSMGISKNF